MNVNRSQSVAVDKVVVICKLHEIADYYLSEMEPGRSIEKAYRHSTRRFGILD